MIFPEKLYCRFVKQLDDNLIKVLIFGHNYALTNIVNSLGTIAIDNVPTSAWCKSVLMQSLGRH